MSWGRFSWSRDRELRARVAERALKLTSELWKLASLTFCFIRSQLS